MSISGVNTGLSMLTTDQAQVWFNTVSQINALNEDPPIVIVQLGHSIEIPIYNNRDNISDEKRYLFKQNINKQVDCYLFKNQVNSSILSNIYDQCHGTLSTQEVEENVAGIYVYTGDGISSGLGIILVKITNSFQWFNATKFYSFDQQSNVKNGTQLSLAFETMIYYNSHSDLILLNKKVKNIIQQANIAIINDETNNLQTFFSMENLSCQRHEQILNDDLRLLTFVCIVKVTFKCPLTTRSTCWIENKRMSNIILNIDSLTFISDRTVSVRIDV